jgi:ABC-2 type transport system permease protein
MNRTPVFFLNGVLVVIILPAFFILMTKSGTNSLGPTLQNLVASGNALSIVLILASFMVVCGVLNGTSSSTFSREGAQFWISRVIPVTPGEQIAAKFLHSYLIGLLGMATALVVAIFVLHPLKIHLALAMGLAMVTGVLLTAVGMMIDLARPLLDWINPQKAIKQNLNVLLAMFADIGIMTAAYFGVRALRKTAMTGTAIIWILYAVLIGLAVLSTLALLRFARTRYGEMES